MERLIRVLLFSGLCLFTQIIPFQQGYGYGGYVFIQNQKTWYKAQAYCRQHYFDLATLQSSEDWTDLLEAFGPTLTSPVWIGLYKNINTWLWSHQDEKITFSSWRSGQPDNFGGQQNCVYFAYDGWYDRSCGDLNAYFCYNENRSGVNRFVLKTDNKTWLDAQSYCRQFYTDLATIRTQEENNLLLLMRPKFLTPWIGLFRDSWRWSDGTKVQNISWMAGQPEITGMSQPCGATAGPNHLIDDQLCSSALPFICTPHTFYEYSKKQIVRLEVKSDENLNDPAVMETVLQWMKQKLKDHGVEKETTLTWRVQPDGNVFTPKHDREDAAEAINPNQENCSFL